MKRIPLLLLVLMVTSLLLAESLRTLAQPPMPAIESLVPETIAGPDAHSYFYLEQEIMLGQSIFPNDWKLHPNGEKIYVGAYQGLWEIDIAAGTAGRIAPAISNIYRIAFNRDGSRLYAGEVSRNGSPLAIDVVDLTTPTLRHHYPFTHAISLAVAGIAASEDGRIFYTLAADNALNNQLYIMEEISGNIIATVPLTATPPVSGTDHFISHDLFMKPGSNTLFALPTYAEPHFSLSEWHAFRFNISDTIPVIEFEHYGMSWQDARLTPDEAILYLRGYGELLGFSTADFEFDHSLVPQAPLDFTYLRFEVSLDGSTVVGVDQYDSETIVDIFDYGSQQFVSRLADDFSYVNKAGFPLGNGRYAILYGDRLRVFATGHRVIMPIAPDEYCRAGLIDDFSDPSSGWPRFNQNGLHANYFQGEYGVDHQNANSWLAVTAGHEWNDGLVQVNGRSLGNGIWGFALGITPNWDHMITLEVYPRERWLVIQEYFAGSGWTVLFSDFAPNLSYDPLAYNRFEIRQDRRLQINDFRLHLVLPDRLEGRIGLTSGAFSGGTGQRFDDYYFFRRTCPLPPDTEALPAMPPEIGAMRPTWPLTPTNRLAAP